MSSIFPEFNKPFPFPPTHSEVIFTATIFSAVAFLTAGCQANNEGNPVGDITYYGKTCPDTVGKLFEGEDKNLTKKLPTGCSAKIVVGAGATCTATFIPHPDVAVDYLLEPQVWDLRADPYIKGSNSGFTGVKCEFIQVEESTPLPPIQIEAPPTPQVIPGGLMPTPTLAPTLEPTGRIKDNENGIVSVFINKIADFPEDYADNILNQLSQYYSGRINSITGVLPKGIRGVKGPGGEMIGFMARTTNGKFIHFLRELNPSTNKYEWSMVQIEYQEPPRPDYNHPRNNPLNPANKVGHGTPQVRGPLHF